MIFEFYPWTLDIDVKRQRNCMRRMILQRTGL